MRKICLKPKQDLRLRDGHLWIFSNEIDTKKTPLSDFAMGENVNVVDASGQNLGSATINPKTLIAARLHARSPNTPLDSDLLVKRLKIALDFRQSLFANPWYRLVHAEGDYLPGLVIDRYDAHLSVQITTQALEQRKDVLLDILHDLIKPEGIVLANDIFTRSLEDLSLVPQTMGDVPEFIELKENGATFTVPIISGQKTGWFYDQRENRLLAARLASGKRVLDACCYLGGFGVLAAINGAKEVTFVDSSVKAIALATKNLQENAPGRLKKAVIGDVFDVLTDLINQKETFDFVSIDPPAFIKRRKDVSKGQMAYRKLNNLAIQLLSKNGLLVSSSCSYHLTAESLRLAILRGAKKNNRSVQIISSGRQGYDHPYLLGMPETAYLKCYLAKLN